jgi:MoaA/NifB/PqqE/SkfB family radical SAM enzyme
MTRLFQLFSNIARIRLLGGEPLLHPLISEFIEATRCFFPKSNLSLVTNGILLPTMDDRFYEVLKNNNITLDVTVYPPLKDKIPELVSRAVQYEIPVHYQYADYFCRFLNPHGTSDKEKTHKECWVNYCTFLREGKIYPCALPALAHIINQKFGWNIPDDGYIDIHSDITGDDIWSFIWKPISTCAYCTKGTWFSWEQSQQQPDEWLD